MASPSNPPQSPYPNGAPATSAAKHTSEATMAWLTWPSVSNVPTITAGISLTPSESVPCWRCVIDVISIPPTSASANACQFTPSLMYEPASSLAVDLSPGNATMKRATISQPAIRLDIKVVSHNRTRAPGLPCFVTTAATGRRKFSVNSSLPASVNAMKPDENAMAANSGL